MEVENLRFRLNIFEPLTFERIVRRDSLLRIQREHLIKQVQSRVGHVRKFLPESSSILFLRLQRVEVRQLDDVGPHGWRWRPAQSRNDLQLQRLGASLEKSFLGEQLAEDAADAPNVDRWPVSEMIFFFFTLNRPPSPSRVSSSHLSSPSSSSGGRNQSVITLFV